MMQNEKYLKESIDILNRKFGEPLPTLEDTMKAHKLKKEGGPGSGRKPEPGSAKDIEKNKKVSTTEPKIDDARGATNHLFLLNLSNIWISSNSINYIYSLLFEHL